MNLGELTKLYDFTGKTAVVTGGAGVLGGAMSRALAGCNANVFVLGRDLARARTAADALARESRGRILPVRGDVLEVESLRRALEAVRSEVERVDILINAAGGNRPSAVTSADLSFFDLLPEALHEVADLNLLGTILPCQIFGRDMAERGEGVILNVSSMNAYRPLTRTPAYSAAKAAVTNFTQWLAVHMAQEYSPKIRVNAIAPGFFVGEQNRRLLLNEDDTLTARGQAILAHTPQGRFGEPDDLLGAALWLVSPAAAFVTGVVVPIDGGFSAFSGV